MRRRFISEYKDLKSVVDNLGTFGTVTEISV